MVFSGGFGAGEPPRVSAPPAGATPIAMITAIDRARRLFPQAAFSGVQFPSADAPYYAVQLRQPGEAGRAYATPLVSVAAADGRIVDTVDPFAMSGGGRALHLLSISEARRVGKACVSQSRSRGCPDH